MEAPPLEGSSISCTVEEGLGWAGDTPVLESLLEGLGGSVGAG